ncbi:MAG TPA: GAF domain-containing protein, partial [Tepidisphaeraceae bacterium]|nr:GAF domain-containing protein [Tepidisphaeraceae bacterium]
MAERVTLQNCDQEPIHIPGSIQPHGVLLALDPHCRVLQVSENTPALLDRDPHTLLGTDLRALLDRADAETVCARLRATHATKRPIHLRTLRAAGRVFDAIAHHHDDVLILELEPLDDDPADTEDLYGRVQRAIVDFRSARDLPHLGQLIAEHVRHITGFDRVMVYRFDAEWNGQVIAEEKRDDLEPFLGLNYPASDIPAQARELYRKNWLRFIADRDYKPAPIIPPHNPLTQRPLDMSFAVLRSVSPIHLEYLRNMGVGASMSISLVCDERLWGLIACHHYSPRRVPYKLRTACELLGQVMSLQVIASAAGDASREQHQKQTHMDTVLGRFDPSHGLPGLLHACAAEIISVLGCTGVATISDEEVVRAGQCPPPEGIRDVARAIRDRGSFEIYSTDTLRELVDSGLFDPIAAGVIAISLSADGGQMLLGFRPERLRTVNWAGDPAKSIVKGDGQARLSPRGSFALWKQTVEGRSNPFTDADHTAARVLRQRLMERLVAHADEVRRHNRVLREHGQEQEQKLESERAARMDVERLGRLKDDFVATLSHELRPPLNAIQGWTQLLPSGP